MLKSKKLSVIIAAALLCAAIFSFALPVFADAAPEAAPEEPAEEPKVEEPAELAAEDTTAPVKEKKPVSDVSNIIGIVVAVVIGVGAIAAIILLAPKNTAPKKK